MDEKFYNENEDIKSDETVVFNPVPDMPPEEKKPFKEFPLQTEEVGAYKDYGEEEYEDEDDDEDEYEYVPRKKKSNLGVLITLTVVAVIIFTVTVVWGITRISSMNKEETEIEEIIPPEEKEILEEEPQEKPVKKEEEEDKNILYNMVFLGDTVEREGEYYTVRAKLYNKSKVFEDEKRIILNSDTEITEDGSELDLVSFVYIIENIGDEEFFFKGKINTDTNEVVNISYKSENLVLKEEEEEVILPESEEEALEEETEEKTEE